MGWYDAYKPTNVSRVNMTPVTSNSGSAAKGFGDAFTKIGDSILKVDKAREDKKLADTRNNLLDTQNQQNQKILDAWGAHNTEKLKKEKQEAISLTNTNDSFAKNDKAKRDALNATTDYKNSLTTWQGKKSGAFDKTNGLKDKGLDLKNKKQTLENGLYTQVTKAKIAKDNKDTGLDDTLKMSKLIDSVVPDKIFDKTSDKSIINPDAPAYRSYLLENIPILVKSGKTTAEAISIAMYKYNHKKATDELSQIISK